jgi:hypothetical protein
VIEEEAIKVEIEKPQPIIKKPKTPPKKKLEHKPRQPPPETKKSIEKPKIVEKVEEAPKIED